MKVVRAPRFDPSDDGALRIDASAVADWLVRFLVQECRVRRKTDRVVLGLSGGVDSAVSAALCARAFGPENTHVFRLPYRSSSQASLDDAQAVAERFGLPMQTIDVSPMVDGYFCQAEPDMSPLRLGNVCARCRTTILYDQSAELKALPIGTGNKTERLFGYFTWHADDAPAINPLGDLFKTQVWQLARELGVPEQVVTKPPTADLVQGQTDEGDFGISFADADRILLRLVQGYRPEKLVEWGFDESQVKLVVKKVASTHWKRHLPTVAMLTDTAVNEYYLRPVDY